jgi:hypothetical protein
MRDGKVHFDKRTNVFKPERHQQWHESQSVHHHSMRLSVDMASTIFLVHKRDIHHLHLSVPADVQEPDEAGQMGEGGTEGSGQKRPNGSKTKQNTRDSLCGIKLVGSNTALFF